jgi:hypothetical protein
VLSVVGDRDELEANEHRLFPSSCCWILVSQRVEVAGILKFIDRDWICRLELNVLQIEI